MNRTLIVWVVGLLLLLVGCGGGAEIEATTIPTMEETAVLTPIGWAWDKYVRC